MKVVTKTIILRTALGVAIYFALVYGFRLVGPSCGEDSEAVAYARTLSAERLQTIFTDIQTMASDPDLPIEGLRIGGEYPESPEAFSDLEAKEVVPSKGKLVLEWCTGTEVHLAIAETPATETAEAIQEITLVWGDPESDGGSETLWSSQVEENVN